MDVPDPSCIDSWNIAKRRRKVALPHVLRWSCSHSVSFKVLEREIFKSNNIKIKEGIVMTDAEREFWDTPMDRRPIFDLGVDNDSAESSNRSSSGGSSESKSEIDDHRGDDNDECGRVEGEDEHEHSEHENAECGRVEGGTYTPSDDMFHDVVGDVCDEDESNPPNVHLVDSHRERSMDEECPECAAHREGVNPDDSIYSYLRTIDSSLSRLDGRISSLDSRVSNMEENMTDMKGQLSTILSLLQSMCKSLKIPPLHLLPTPPLEPDTTTTSPTNVEPIKVDVPQTEANMSALHTMPHTKADMSDIPEADTSGIVTTTEGVTLES
ncbi:uncharacterized protein LOC120067672 [Benincasa hispida]|uniref:uncharacterized protein LOC120067672 n=1 Tax=Benincasa hispida TaxID=102211 RepID=UPI0018FF4FFA|nr:uncharacterized protein LOC120067672 [Benincasa hispida]